MSEVPDYAHMTVEDLDAIADEAVAKRRAEGRPPQLLGDRALRTVGTVPISIRLPETLLDRLKLEATNRGMSYQRLLKQLVAEGLERPAAERQVHKPAPRTGSRTAARRSR
ncbi:MAG TPA: CopG family antitoxin [Candidatus Dormibacteraeota bacterium]|jgi:hypothetical protein|nr:CopG family antitoxin [Candidatus Dormibacteraeota bacterium]